MEYPFLEHPVQAPVDDSGSGLDLGLSKGFNECERFCHAQLRSLMGSPAKLSHSGNGHRVFISGVICL